MDKTFDRTSAFTIVELLVVIVVIGILAAITIVSYGGISQRAVIATIKSDLKNASTQLEIDKITNDKYPANLLAANNGSGLKYSSGTTYQYRNYSGTDAYCIVATNKNESYYITSNNKVPTLGAICPPITFAVAAGGINNGMINVSTRTVDGGYVSASDITTSSSDVLIKKYDSSGILSWSKTWGGADSDSVSSIIQTSDGGYAITGSTRSFGVDATYGSLYISKFTADGSFSWSRLWNGAMAEVGNSLIQTVDGGYIISGNTSSYGVNAVDAVFIKYASDGTFVWNKTWGGTGNDGISSITATNDGGFIGTGYSYQYGVGVADMALVKYDASGSLTWNKTWGGASWTNGTSIIQTSDGGYVATGYSDNYSSGNQAVIVIKLTSLGAVSWSRSWGGSGNDYGISIIEASDGGFAVGGYTDSFGGVGNDMLLIKYDSSGTFEWNRTFGGTGDDILYSLMNNTDNGYTLSGTTSSLGANPRDGLLVQFSTAGNIAGCSASMCKDPTAMQTSNLSATITTPTVTSHNPSAGMTSQSAATNTITLTTTTIVAP